MEKLSKRRNQKIDQQEEQQKKLEQQRIKVREQLAKHNQEMIRQRQEKQKEEEVKKKIEEEKKLSEKVVIEGPSKEFMERVQKSQAKQPPITDWKVYRKRHGLDDATKIFICSKAYQPLIKELERRGWHRNKDRQSLIFDLKYVILESESSMLVNDLKPFQMVNHFYRNNLITTKVGLQHSLKNLIWSSSTPMDEFFPRCYDMSDFKEIDEFKEEHRIIRAESILKKYVKKQEVANIEVLLIALHVNEKRLKDVDEQIDDGDLSGVISDD